MLARRSRAGWKEGHASVSRDQDPGSGWNPADVGRAAQVVGLKSGWHAAAVMGTTQVHAKRLAQACEMRLELLAHGKHSALCRRTCQG